MKAFIIRDTSIKGKPVHKGQSIEVDTATFHLLHSSGKATEDTEATRKLYADLNPTAAEKRRQS